VSEENQELAYMNIIIEFNQAAFKHGVTEADIRNAIINVLYDDIWDDTQDKHLLLDFDCNSNLLEIMYNVVDEQTVNVFHAMKCQSIYLSLLK
jgi:ERCC4-type nuclease